MNPSLVVVEGELELRPWHACLPDVLMMVDDIERETRRLHGGKLVKVIPTPPGRTPSIIHVYISDPVRFPQ